MRTYSFTEEQFIIILRGTIGIANELYSRNKSDDEVFKLTIASQIQGLLVERALVDRGAIAKTEFQIYEKNT